MNYTINSTVFNDWKIVREIGEGSFGKVFEIEKTDFGVTSRSALKVITVPKTQADVRLALSDGMDERSVTSYFQGFVDELVKEISVMSSLKAHAGIVSCEDHKVIPHTGELGWDILIRMELLTPLTEYQMTHPFDEELVRKMAMDLTSALAFCQKKSLIHRDIKPENIFVSMEDTQFKLGDFGVARTASKTTGGLSKKGTEIYMAPEVYLAQPYGCSVDVYSLGLVLYKFMNHGRLPFLPAYPAPITFADRENSMAQRMQGVPIPPPADASPEFAQIILKACAYQPQDRYLTAEDMLAALQALPAVKKEAGAAPTLDPIANDPTDSGTTIGIWGRPTTPEPSIAPSYQPTGNPSYRPNAGTAPKQVPPQYVPPQQVPPQYVPPQPPPAQRAPQQQPQYTAPQYMQQPQYAPQPQASQPIPSQPQFPQPPVPKSGSKKGLIIGLCCGAAFVILGIIGAIIGITSSGSSNSYVSNDEYNYGTNSSSYYDAYDDSEDYVVEEWSEEPAAEAIEEDPYATDTSVNYAQATYSGLTISDELLITEPLTGYVTDVYSELYAGGLDNAYLFYFEPGDGYVREDAFITSRDIYLGATLEEVMAAYGTAWIHTTLYDSSHWVYEVFPDMYTTLSESASYVAYQLDTDWFIEFHFDQNYQVCYIVIFYGDYDYLIAN